MKYVPYVHENLTVLINQIPVGTWSYETRRDSHSIVTQIMKILLSVVQRAGGKFSS